MIRLEVVPESKPSQDGERKGKDKERVKRGDVRDLWLCIYVYIYLIM